MLVELNKHQTESLHILINREQLSNTASGDDAYNEHWRVIRRALDSPSNIEYVLQRAYDHGNGLDFLQVTELLAQIDTEPKPAYGTHAIPSEWVRIDNVYIWFASIHKKHQRGIPGYVFKKPDGTFVAPCRGELKPVIQDTKDEFREITNNPPKATQTQEKDV